MASTIEHRNYGNADYEHQSKRSENPVMRLAPCGLPYVRPDFQREPQERIAALKAWISKTSELCNPSPSCQNNSEKLDRRRQIRLTEIALSVAETI
jgi:hypothetical protein